MLIFHVFTKHFICMELSDVVDSELDIDSENFESNPFPQPSSTIISFRGSGVLSVEQ